MELLLAVTWRKGYSYYIIIATNQAANFTAYQEFKKMAQKYQNLEELPSYQHLILGGVSGAMGK